MLNARGACLGTVPDAACDSRSVNAPRVVPTERHAGAWPEWIMEGPGAPATGGA